MGGDTLKTITNVWNTKKIVELPISLIDGDRSGKYPKRSEFVEDGIVFLNAESISGGCFDLSKVNYISQEKFNTISKGRLQRNDLVLTMRGNGVGDIALFPSNPPTGLINAQMLILRPNNEKIDPIFLYYCFKNPQFQNELKGYVSGSAQPQLTITHLRFVPISYPSLSKQKAIAHILGTLDDKIELNRQMNETLEAMAQVLFKSWFVDFDPVIDNAIAAGNEIPDALKAKAATRQALGDARKPLPEEIRQLFPSSFEYSEEMGWIPEGWDVRSLNSLLRSVSDTYPLKKVEKVVFLNTGDVLDGKFLHRDFSSPIGLPGQAKKSIQQNDILYSEIRPKNKRFAYVHFDSSEYVVSTKLMVLRATTQIKSIFTYLILKQESTIGYLQLMAESRSGTFPQITFDVLSTINIALPTDNIIVDYFTDQVLEPAFDMQIQKNSSSQQLTRLRDTLLPKLLSGQLRIPDAEKLVEEAL